MTYWLTGLITTVFTILATSAGIFYWYWYNLFNHWKRRGVTYVKPDILFGNFTDVVLRRKQLNEQVIYLYNYFKTEPYIGIFIFNRPYLMIKDPDIIKLVLIKEFNTFCDRGMVIDENVDPLAFNTLFTARGNTWRASRQKLAPAFSSGKIRLMMPLIDACCQNLVDVLRKDVGKIVDLKELLNRYTIDVISQCAFGFDSKTIKNKDGLIHNMARQLHNPESKIRGFAMVCMFFLPSVAKALKLTVGDKTAMAFFQNLFKKVMDEREQNGVVKNDFVDMLLSMKNQEDKNDEYKLDDIRMAGQVISFFFAGNDSTSTALSFLINEIAVQKDIQDKIRTEIEKVSTVCKELNYEALQELKYMDMVIKETLRKYPISPMLFRVANEDYILQQTGLKIEAETHIVIPLSGIHNDPTYYPEPDTFDPERFHPSRNHNAPYTFLSFGIGPRVCIGERFAWIVMKMVLCRMLTNFEFIKCADTQYPIEINRVSAFLQPKKVPVGVISAKRD